MNKRLTAGNVCGEVSVRRKWRLTINDEVMNMCASLCQQVYASKFMYAVVIYH